MFKDELLDLLDDKDVRRKIFKIIGAVNEELEEEIFRLQEKLKSTLAEKDFMAYEAAKKFSELEEENFRLKEEVQTLAEKNSDSNDEVQSQKLFSLESEMHNLTEKLKATFADKNSALNQLDSLRKENFYLKNTLSKAQQQVKNFQSNLENYQRELDAAHNKISRLKNSVDELNAQLETRFNRGWELFQNYQRVGANTRQLLKGVFPRDDFTSFICGGAQTNSLETIWDVLRDCIIGGNRQDSEILWEIFEYCLELVNASKVKASYSVLPVKVGDRFDSDFHIEAPGSRAQGKISAVYLPGYKNDYNGCVIKKSVVQVS